MKRRTFLQSIIAGFTALFLPKAKADVDSIVKETLAKDPNWRDTQKETEPVWPCNYDLTGRQMQKRCVDNNPFNNK